MLRVIERAEYRVRRVALQWAEPKWRALA